MRIRFKLDYLAGELGKSRMGKGRFDAFAYHELTTVLLTAFPFSESLSPTDREGVLNRAISALGGAKFTGDALKKAIETEQRSFLRARPEPYVLVSSVSVTLPPHIHRAAFWNNNVILSKWLPRRLAVGRRSPTLEIAKEDQVPSSYTWAIVKVEARSVHQGTQQALDKLDLLRAGLNFRPNRRVWVRFGSHPQEPVNTIRLGKIHTLHKPDGSPARNGHWYEPTYRERRFASISDADWKSLIAGQRQLHSVLKTHPYSDFIQSALVRYARALDHSDAEVSLLKLWALLETLTQTGFDSYDTTIRRAQFLFSDRDLTYQVLEHLRLRRNLTVHHDQSSEDAPTLVYQLKRYVEQLLTFHLGTGLHLRSLSDAILMLDQPASVPELRSRMGVIRRAVRFLS